MLKIVYSSLLMLSVSIFLSACGEGASEEDPSNGVVSIIDNMPSHSCNRDDPNFELPSGTRIQDKIREDLTIGPGCYYASGSVFIDNGAQLTILPDTILEFKPNTGLFVEDGNIFANGTPSNPIYFTTDTQPKHKASAWIGISVQGESTRQIPNVFNYTVIEYAGAIQHRDDPDQGANIKFYVKTRYVKPINDRPRIIFTNNVVRESSGKFAFYANRSTYFDRIENNIFYNNAEYPASVDVNEAHFFNNTNKFFYNSAGNDVNRLYIRGERLNVTDSRESQPANSSPNSLPVTNITWENIGIDYELEGFVDIRKTNLYIQPGINISFHSGGGLYLFGNDASLNLEGTAIAPINLSSAILTEQWQGVSYDNSNNQNNILKHVNFSGTGAARASTNLPEPANLSLANEAIVSVSNTTLNSSSGFGLIIDESSTLNNFTNNQLLNNSMGVAKISAKSAHFLLPTTESQNTYAGDPSIASSNAIELISDPISSNHTFHNLGIPYIVKNDLTITGDVTINPGVKLLFDDRVRFSVQSGGSLNAVGTFAEPIVLDSISELTRSSSVPIDIYWQGVIFNNSNDTNKNRFEFVTINYAGVPARVNTYGAIRLFGTSSLAIGNAQINFLSPLSSAFPTLVEQNSSLVNLGNNNFIIN